MFTPEQFAVPGKAGVEAALSLAQAQFAALERLAALNLTTAKAVLEDNAVHAKALLGAKDVQEYMSLSTATAQPALEKAIAYSRSLYEVASQTQGEFAKLAESQAAEFNKNLVGLLDKVSTGAPAGSDVAVAAVKSALAAANTAYDSFSKVAKQASEIAEANFAAATTVAKEAPRKRAAAAA
jgi:phasin family protein